MTVMSVHALSYSLPDSWEAAVDGWLTWLVAAGSSSATRRTRRAHVRRVARELRSAHPQDVTDEQLLTIIGRPDLSTEHRRGLRGSLASFYRWAVVFGVVEVDPVAGLPLVRAAAGKPQPVTDEVWCELLETADVRTRLMARLACEAGLRRAEVACVHTDDLIDGADGAQLIVHGKGDKQRVVPITVSLADEIHRTQPYGGFLFPGQIDGHMSADSVGRLVSKAMPPGWSMHKLRHRFATRGYAGTGNLRAVQEALGHASVATTQRYTAVAAPDLRAVTDAATWASGTSTSRAGRDTDTRTRQVQESPRAQVVESTPPVAAEPIADAIAVDDQPHGVHAQRVPPDVASTSGRPTEHDVKPDMPPPAPPSDPPAPKSVTNVRGAEGLSKDDIAFASVIASWNDEPPRCQATTLADNPAECRRAANWRINMHGCDQALLCGQHKSIWVRRYQHTGRGRCERCNREFARFEDVCSITRL